MSTETTAKENNKAPKHKQAPLYFASGDSKAFTITETGIEIRKNISFEDWRTGLKYFRWAQLNFKVALADYIKFGELKFGSERAGEAISQLEFPMADISRAVDLNSVPQNIRDKGLSSEHLVVLARGGLNDKEMEKWAGEAKKHSMTPVQLKESIKQGIVVTAEVAKKNTHGVITIQAIRMEAEIWLRRMGGMEALITLDDEAREEIRSELVLFVEIAQAVKR